MTSLSLKGWDQGFCDDNTTGNRWVQKIGDVKNLYHNKN